MTIRLHALLRIMGAMLVAVQVAACGDTGTEEQNAQVAQSDADAIAAFILGQPTVPGIAPQSAGAPSASVNLRAVLAILTVRRLIAAETRYSLAAAQTPPSGPFTINETVNCPQGGTGVITGQGNRAPNQQTRQTAVTFSPTITYNNCALGTGQGTAGITLRSGSLTGNGTANWQWPAQVGGTPTLLTFNLTRSGTVSYAKGTQTGSCQVSLTSTAQGDTWSTTGTICDKQVSSNRKPLGLRN